MKGKQLVLAALGGSRTATIPWVPFVGVHGGHLIGKNANEYLHSAALMVSGISKAIELYDPDGIPVCFDLQIEAEALGCELGWADENPPAVLSHPLAGKMNLADLKPLSPEQGRIPAVLAATRELRKKYPDIALYGLVTGPFTLGLHLLGTEIFMKMFEDPASIHKLLDFAASVTLSMSQYYLDAGCDIIAVVDPMTSQIGPDQFTEFIHQPVKSVFDDIRSQGKFSSFFVCGHAQQNIEVMCKTGPDNISIDENIPLDYVRKICSGHGISFGGNLQLTLVMLMGTPEDCQKNAVECMDIAGDTGFILAPGCDLPMKTPVKNLQAVSQVVRDTYQQEVIRTLEHKPGKTIMMNLDDYGKSDRVIVDIITLDSESCAPCQYMVEAVREVAPHFEGLVEWREHSIKNLEGVTFMSSLFVKNIPTICIDGKITFVSQIPPRNELIRAIQNRINEKLKIRLRVKQGEILLLGKSAGEIAPLRERTLQAIAELGVTIEVREETDSEIIQSLGIAQTPAFVTVKYKIRSEAGQPGTDVIKEWIKETI
ncbi:MAG: uroporphyrinogen decarboxylase family protein [Bacteroidales bacterium]|jgi:uroporphyrinogen decarboxylase